MYGVVWLIQHTILQMIHGPWDHYFILWSVRRFCHFFFWFSVALIFSYLMHFMRNWNSECANFSLECVFQRSHSALPFFFLILFFLAFDRSHCTIDVLTVVTLTWMKFILSMAMVVRAIYTLYNIYCLLFVACNVVPYNGIATGTRFSSIVFEQIIMIWLTLFLLIICNCKKRKSVCHRAKTAHSLRARYT